jgi:hypothetical protein
MEQGAPEQRLLLKKAPISSIIAGNLPRYGAYVVQSIRGEGCCVSVGFKEGLWTVRTFVSKVK